MTQTKTIIAIDPGASGGIVVRYAPHKNQSQPEPSAGNVMAYKMPETLEGAGALLKEMQYYSLSQCGHNPVVYCEQVGGYNQSKGKQPGSAMFNFGMGYGFIRGTCYALGLSVVLVTPQRWQKALGCGTHDGRTGPQWKNHLKGIAQRLYPGLKVTNATADALLILRYGELMEGKETEG